MSLSLIEQNGRLQRAGFPKAVIVSVAEGVLKKIRKDVIPRPETGQARQKIAVVPYMHRTAHSLGKIAKRVNVKAVYSAPEKLAKMCKMTDPFRKAPTGCPIKHRSPFVACTEGVVYRIPLSCGKIYVGQTARCLNVRLREHYQKVNGVRDGHLSCHCHDCGCKPLFASTTVLARHNDKTVREIMEADTINSSGTCCVSVASIDLADKELAYLRSVAGPRIG